MSHARKWKDAHIILVTLIYAVTTNKVNDKWAANILQILSAISSRLKLISCLTKFSFYFVAHKQNWK